MISPEQQIWKQKLRKGKYLVLEHTARKLQSKDWNSRALIPESKCLGPWPLCWHEGVVAARGEGKAGPSGLHGLRSATWHQRPVSGGW